MIVPPIVVDHRGQVHHFDGERPVVRRRQTGSWLLVSAIVIGSLGLGAATALWLGTSSPGECRPGIYLYQGEDGPQRVVCSAARIQDGRTPASIGRPSLPPAGSETESGARPFSVFVGCVDDKMLRRRAVPPDWESGLLIRTDEPDRWECRDGSPWERPAPLGVLDDEGG